MSKVNYNEISQIYDEVRRADIDLISSFLQEIEIDKETRVLDMRKLRGKPSDIRIAPTLRWATKVTTLKTPTRMNSGIFSANKCRYDDF